MKTFTPSRTVQIHGLAQKKRSLGEKIYNFSAGDPLIKVHPSITDRIKKELSSNEFPYPPLKGLAELREKAAAWMGWNMENIIVTPGGKFAIYAACTVLLEPQDEVLIAAPYWGSFPEIVKIAGGEPIIIPAKKITGKDLRLHASKKTKMLIFNNACNPTGTLYNREEIGDILQTAQSLGLTVISDEVYSELVYEGAFVSAAEFNEYKENVITIQSGSKSFAMPGCRIGFLGAPAKIAETVSLLQSQSTTGTSLPSQWGALGALDNKESVTRYVRDAMKKRRDHFVRTFNRLFDDKIEAPASALYAFVPLSHFKTSLNSVDFCEKLLDKYNILIVPGSVFGDGSAVRFSFAEEEKMIVDGLEALKKAAEAL
jgi:aspartate/methionine/tyrosine aminotransferase